MQLRIFICNSIGRKRWEMKRGGQLGEKSRSYHALPMWQDANCHAEDRTTVSINEMDAFDLSLP